MVSCKFNIVEQCRNVAPKSKGSWTSTDRVGIRALDLAARGKGHVLGGAPAETTHPLAKLQMRNLNSPQNHPRSDPALSPPRDMPAFPITVVNGIARRGIRLSPPELSQRKRKYVADHMALDVLAEVSMNSPLIH